MNRQRQIERKRRKRRDRLRARKARPATASTYVFSGCLHMVAAMVAEVESMHGTFAFVVSEGHLVTMFTSVDICADSTCPANHRIDLDEAVDLLAESRSVCLPLYRSSRDRMTAGLLAVPVTSSSVGRLYPAGRCG